MINAEVEIKDNYPGFRPFEDTFPLMHIVSIIENNYNLSYTELRHQQKVYTITLPIPSPILNGFNRRNISALLSDLKNIEVGTIKLEQIKK